MMLDPLCIKLYILFFICTHPIILMYSVSVCDSWLTSIYSNNILYITKNSLRKVFEIFTIYFIKHNSSSLCYSFPVFIVSQNFHYAILVKGTFSNIILPVHLKKRSSINFSYLYWCIDKSVNIIILKWSMPEYILQ